VVFKIQTTNIKNCIPPKRVVQSVSKNRLPQGILEYKRERKRRQLETVDEMVKESQRLGLYTKKTGRN